MLEKIQHFLKTKHKFDKKLTLQDQFELFSNQLLNLKNASKAENKNLIRQNLGILLVEFLKFANLHDININELFQKDMKININ